jgi:hypothetical protein
MNEDNCDFRYLSDLAGLTATCWSVRQRQVKQGEAAFFEQRSARSSMVPTRVRKGASFRVRHRVPIPRRFAARSLVTDGPVPWARRAWQGR